MEERPAPHDARLASEVDMSVLFKRTYDVLKGGDVGSDAVSTLLQTLIAARRVYSIPQRIIDVILSTLVEPMEGSSKLRLQCLVLLHEISPCSRIMLASCDPPVERRQIPHLIRLAMAQGSSSPLYTRHSPSILTWVTSSSVEAEIKAASLMFTAQAFRLQALEAKQWQEIQSSIVDFLRNTSTTAAPAPASRIFSSPSRGNVPMLEIDGTKSRDFFTVLSIARYYSNDQLLNMQAFSILLPWINARIAMARSVAAPLSVKFKENVMEYCLRVVDQALLKPSEDQDICDRTHIQLCLMESVRILDALCRCDASLVNKVYPAMKKVINTKIGLSDELRLNGFLSALAFFVEHGSSVTVDYESSLHVFLGTFMDESYVDPLLSFEFVSFCLKHSQALAPTALLPSLFPVMFKILAWHPRVLLGAYLELLPAFITKATCAEVFHSILDLPCLAAALEKSQGVAELEGKGKVANVYIVGALSNYILRKEGGLGGTIDSLEDLHAMFAGYALSPRVQVAASIVSPLLLAFFKIFIAYADYAAVLNLVSTILERVSKLYPIPKFKADVIKILSDEMLALFELHPMLIVDAKAELLDFISNRRNVTDGREKFFMNVVYIIGQYSSTNMDPRCTVPILIEFHEVLDSLTYEVNAMMQSKEPGPYKNVHFTRLTSVLMTALAKIASRHQELIPLVQLCLTKVIKQHSEANHAASSIRDAIVERATQLYNTLQQPSVASVTMNTSSSIDALVLRHDDTNTALSIIRAFAPPAQQES